MGPLRSEPIPVRIRLELLADGSTARSPIVYCDPQKRTVPLARCATCGFGGRVERDAADTPRTVGCTRFVVPSCPPALVLEPSIAACGVQGIAASFSVGLVLIRDVLCVAADVSLQTFSQAMVDDGVATAPIVDGQGRLLGVLPRNRTRLSRFASFADDTVAEHARDTPLIIDEERPLADAFV